MSADFRDIAARLDRISRTRALTTPESLTLERALKEIDKSASLNCLSQREAARAGVKLTDPRIRRVVSSQLNRGNDHTLTLDCGHVQRRRLMAVPHSVVCVDCKPPADWAAKNLTHRYELPEAKRPILERLEAARDHMAARQRTPRAFYLGAEDYAEFEGTNPPTIVATFRDHPVPVLGWDGLAVRLSQGSDRRGKSVLYCCNGTGVQVPIR